MEIVCERMIFLSAPAGRAVEIAQVFIDAPASVPDADPPAQYDGADPPPLEE